MSISAVGSSRDGKSQNNKKSKWSRNTLYKAHTKKSISDANESLFQSNNKPYKFTKYNNFVRQIPKHNFPTETQESKNFTTDGSEIGKRILRFNKGVSPPKS